MKLSECFPSNFLKSDDLQGKDVKLTIKSAAQEKVGNDVRLVLSFAGTQKTMVVNKTNANRIAYLYGDETDDWTGKQIVITSEFVEYQGRTVKGLRVKPPGTPQPPRPATPQPAAMTAKLGPEPPPIDEDAIPF